MCVASVVIVVSRVESLLGSAVAALEREEREEELRFQMVDLWEITDQDTIRINIPLNPTYPWKEYPDAIIEITS